MGWRKGERAKLEDSTLIDATTFANSYNAFWHASAPTCEHFVRRINIGNVQRFEAPMDGSITTNRALISEYAFSLFAEKKKESLAVGAKRLDDLVEEAAWLMAEARLAPYMEQGLVLNRDFNRGARSETNEITCRLLRFFDNPKQRLVLRPIFLGCGFVDSSEGDVIIDETIYEVKTVDRRFRGSDIRQSITYAALNASSRQFDIKRVGLFNPRRGLFWEAELDYVCTEIAGISTQEFLGTIINAMSSGEISR